MKENEGLNRIKARIQKHFESSYSFQGIHGSNEWCLENIAFSIGSSEEDMIEAKILDFYDFYLRKFCQADEVMSSDFVRSMMLNCLLYMGKKINKYDPAIVEAFHQRLERVYQFAISGEKIFYTHEERKHIKSIPAAWRNAGIVRSEHTNPYLLLPNVYDLLGFSAMYGRTKEADIKMDKIAEYIFSAQYQEETELGYGIGINGENGFVKSTYYAVGWDVCLSHLTQKQTMLYMILLSPVSSARSTQWYKTNREKYIKAVETGDTSFLFEIGTSVRKTYWSSGCYLDFGRNKQEKIDKVVKWINRLPV